MSQHLVELMKMAEAQRGKETEELIEAADELGERYDKQRLIKASAELFSILTRYTSGEAATVVKGAAVMDGVAAYGLLHENYSKKTMGRMFRIQRECMYPKEVKELSGVKIAILEWEEKWKRMNSELGADVKIPVLWRMSALLEICPKDLKEQMLMRLDEIGEDYEALKHKIVSYTTNKVEQNRASGGVAMEVDNVYAQDAGDEYDEGDWINAVGPHTRCYECGGFGHLARDCPAKGKGKGKGAGGKFGGKGAWGEVRREGGRKGMGRQRLGVG